MSKQKDIAKEYKKGTTLWWIGWWATIWWAISLLYIVWWFWLASITYAQYVTTGNNISAWADAVGSTFAYSEVLQMQLMILAIWLVGGLWWVSELQRKKITLRAAFKDLFGTIR
jgi:hypothetical protein